MMNVSSYVAMKITTYFNLFSCATRRATNWFVTTIEKSLQFAHKRISKFPTSSSCHDHINWTMHNQWLYFFGQSVQVIRSKSHKLNWVWLWDRSAIVLLANNTLLFTVKFLMQVKCVRRPWFCVRTFLRSGSCCMCVCVFVCVGSRGHVSLIWTPRLKQLQIVIAEPWESRSGQAAEGERERKCVCVCAFLSVLLDSHKLRTWPIFNLHQLKTIAAS